MWLCRRPIPEIEVLHKRKRPNARNRTPHATDTTRKQQERSKKKRKEKEKGREKLIAENARKLFCKNYSCRWFESGDGAFFFLYTTNAMKRSIKRRCYLHPFCERTTYTFAIQTASPLSFFPLLSGLHPLIYFIYSKNII